MLGGNDVINTVFFVDAQGFFIDKGYFWLFFLFGRIVYHRDIVYYLFFRERIRAMLLLSWLGRLYDMIR